MLIALDASRPIGISSLVILKTPPSCGPEIEINRGFISCCCLFINLFPAAFLIIVNLSLHAEIRAEIKFDSEQSKMIAGYQQ